MDTAHSPERPPFVVGVTATYNRPSEVARLLASLSASSAAMRAMIVIDNGGSAAVEEVCRSSPVPVVYHSPGKNLGCGGGLAAGETLALQKYAREMSHLWILDDDVVLEPGCLDILVEVMAAHHAGAAHPLCSGPAGLLGWYPGLTDRAKFRAIRAQQTPEEFIQKCGDAPIPFSWCQGIALLVSREALDKLGVHRGDYWVRGEDLEFSLRVTANYPGLYVPAARARHLPPDSLQATAPDGERAKHLAMLQNIAYTGTRLPHGRSLLKDVPGNIRNFIRLWKLRPSTILAMLRAFWTGAVKGLPAGATRPAAQ